MTIHQFVHRSWRTTLAASASDGPSSAGSLPSQAWLARRGRGRPATTRTERAGECTAVARARALTASRCCWWVRARTGVPVRAVILAKESSNCRREWWWVVSGNRVILKLIIFFKKNKGVCFLV